MKQLGGAGEHENTLDITFKIAGVVQKCHLRVYDFASQRTQILTDMKDVVKEEWRGAEFKIDIRQAPQSAVGAGAPNLPGAELAAKFGRKK